MHSNSTQFQHNSDCVLPNPKRGERNVSKQNLKRRAESIKLFNFGRLYAYIIDYNIV